MIKINTKRSDKSMFSIIRSNNSFRKELLSRTEKLYCSVLNAGVLTVKVNNGIKTIDTMTPINKTLLNISIFFFTKNKIGTMRKDSAACYRFLINR